MRGKGHEHGTMILCCRVVCFMKKSGLFASYVGLVALYIKLSFKATLTHRAEVKGSFHHTKRFITHICRLFVIVYSENT